MVKLGPMALTFDDVLIQPGPSKMMPSEALLTTRLTNNIALKIPLLSAAMDTVSEAKMCIAMAQQGGLGVLHRNMDIKTQVDHVRQVKRFESGMVVNPVTINDDKTLRDAKVLMLRHKITGIPVLSASTQKLVGILTNRDVRFAQNEKQKVKELMTKDHLVTVKESISRDDAMRLLHRHRIEKLLVCDEQEHCIGLITVRDIERSQLYPDATKDHHGRMLVAGAVGTGEQGFERAAALIESECDLIVIDTAHGHSESVLRQISAIKKLNSNIDVIAGNVATGQATQTLVDAGANAIKVGVGPGSICTTRIVSGVGVPQLSAIMESYEVASKCNIPIIADGGIKFSGDIAKAIAVGASCVMIGSLFAGTDESPSEVFLFEGRSYKAYRGMGSMSAMADGAADRYFQQDIQQANKYVPEGVEGRVPSRGPVADIVYQLLGGLRASMGYTGCRTVEDMHKDCILRPITNAGLKESHVHDIIITREPPNYHIV